jgi:hypothetical protein
MKVPSKVLLAIVIISLVAIPVFFNEYLTMQRAIEYSILEDMVDPGTGAKYKLATIYLNTTWNDIDYLLHDSTFLVGIMLMILGTAMFLRVYGREAS